MSKNNIFKSRLAKIDKSMIEESQKQFKKDINDKHLNKINKSKKLINKNPSFDLGSITHFTININN